MRRDAPRQGATGRLGPDLTRLVVNRTRTLRVVFVGWGAISRAAADLLDPSIEIVGVAVRSNVPADELPEGADVIRDPAALPFINADVVVEAASRESVAQWGFPALEAGMDFIVSSVSAFADEDLLASMRDTASRNSVRLEIQSGALGGVDALAAARLLGLDEVEHRIVKPPHAWEGTAAEELCELDALTVAQAFFSGSASEAASAFPKNANVAMTTALAGVGPDHTRITLIADPDATTNRHEIVASGAFGELAITMSNKPLAANPKTSAMTALNLVRTIQNRVAALTI